MCLKIWEEQRSQCESFISIHTIIIKTITIVSFLVLFSILRGKCIKPGFTQSWSSSATLLHVVEIFLFTVPHPFIQTRSSAHTCPHICYLKPKCSFIWAMPKHKRKKKTFSNHKKCHLFDSLIWKLKTFLDLNAQSVCGPRFIDWLLVGDFHGFWLLSDFLVICAKQQQCKNSFCMIREFFRITRSFVDIWVATRNLHQVQLM